MKRINLRDVPDTVYDTLAAGAAARHQSLNAFLVEQLIEIARVLRAADYFASYEPPRGTGITLEDAVAVVHEGRRDAS